MHAIQPIHLVVFNSSLIRMDCSPLGSSSKGHLGKNTGVVASPGGVNGERISSHKRPESSSLVWGNCTGGGAAKSMCYNLLLQFQSLEPQLLKPKGLRACSQQGKPLQ